jgi:hypothetical protein
MDYQNSNSKFRCEPCHYICSKKHHFVQHCLTRKHKMMTGGLPKIVSYECSCGNTYKFKQGLSKHKRSCSLENTLVESEIEKPDSPVSMNLILDILKQNQEFKDLIIEQNKQMMEIVKEGKVVHNTNNTTNNNKFNLNIFLNEKCKDAMNIMDFANSLDIKMKELEDVGTLGYATGISNIIVRGLNELDIYKRPIHCSDLKRESMHVKNQNTWILDKEKTLLESAIKRVARKNILKVKDWKELNPAYSEINSKTMDIYSQILVEATGAFEADEKERVMNKIIRNIAKEVFIDKV